MTHYTPQRRGARLIAFLARAPGEARFVQASYGGSPRRLLDSPAEARFAAAAELIRLTNRDGSEWGTATYSLVVSYGGRAETKYGFVDPVTSRSPDYVDMSGISIPAGAKLLDRIHSHPGNLSAGRFENRYRDDGRLAGPNHYAVGARNRTLCRIRTSGYASCTRI